MKSRGCAAIGAAVALLLAVAAPAAGAVGPYVSLGDSYTAAPIVLYPTGSPLGCGRSTHNYPSDLVAAVSPSSFTDASCSGATTMNMTQPQSVLFGGTNPPQFNALSAQDAVVTIGIGGNDVGLIGVAEECGELDVFDPFGTRCKDHYTSSGSDPNVAAIIAAGPKVAAVLQGIRARTNRATKILLVGYPDTLPLDGSSCWPFVPLSSGDIKYMSSLERQLNSILKSVAGANGATFVDTFTSSIGHDACQSSGTAWVNGYLPTSIAWPLHPNYYGELNMANQVVAALGNSPASTELALRLMRLNPGAQAGGNTHVATAAGARLVGVGTRENFMIALGRQEVIVGGAHHDELGALAPGARIDGRGGPDLLHGSAGADHIYGGPGNDLIYGGPGNDLIYGGPGNDLIYGGAGNDRIYGGAGNDRIIAKRGATMVFPGSGTNEVDVADGRPDDRVVCAAGSINRIKADSGDQLGRACGRRTSSVRHQPSVALAAGAARIQRVTGSGTNGDPYTASCDHPRRVDCVVSAFRARTLSGLWDNESVPAYRCPADHPYLVDRSYQHTGTEVPNGVEILGLGAVGVSITGRSAIGGGAESWALLVTGTKTDAPNSSATNWTSGANSYRVQLHCSSNRRRPHVFSTVPRTGHRRTPREVAADPCAGCRCWRAAFVVEVLCDLHHSGPLVNRGYDIDKAPIYTSASRRPMPPATRSDPSQDEAAAPVR